MKSIYFSFLILFLFSCYQENHYESNDDALASKIDSLQNKVTELKKEIGKTPSKDTVYLEKKEKVTVHTTPTVVTPRKIITEKPIVPKKIKVPDSIVHKYLNGKKSAVEGPRKNDKQFITLYDRSGNVTYVFEDVRLSYQISTTLKFRADGSVESANVHFNPGASLHWYETNITFDNDNTPQIKMEQEMPMRLDNTQRPWFWNKGKKEWYQQEIVKETNTPPYTQKIK